MTPSFRTGIESDTDTDAIVRSANLKKLETISTMKDDWNGNGARAFSATLIKKVQNLINLLVFQPEIFPTAVDTIQLEYDKPDGAHLEIELSETDIASCFSINADGQEKEFELHADAQSLNAFIQQFYG